MKLILKWRYPDEEEIHEHTFYDINPKKITIHYNMLYFEANENPKEKHWTILLNHIVEMYMEEE